MCLEKKQTNEKKQHKQQQKQNKIPNDSKCDRFRKWDTLTLEFGLNGFRQFFCVFLPLSVWST